jgi:hypothetical protein
MNRRILILIAALILISLGILALNKDFYYFKSILTERSKYPSTYFIEPTKMFVACYNTDDCIKAKGTACPPSRGGTEACINKNYMQEYLSSIDILSGKEWEISCPNVDKTTAKECSCINGICNLVSQ